MKLKKEVSLSDFMSTVKQCRSEVYFKTVEGDILNLRSTLFAYIFMAAVSDSARGYLLDGEVVCNLAADSTLLAPFYCLDDWKLGSLQEDALTELLTTETAQRFRTCAAIKPSECKACRLRSLCNSGCPHDWVMKDDVPHNYYCQAFSALLNHALPRLRQIAAEELAWRYKHQ